VQTDEQDFLIRHGYVSRAAVMPRLG